MSQGNDFRLKRCSCGSTPKILTDWDATKEHGGYGVYIQCPNCQLRTPTKHTVAEATNDWNAGNVSATNEFQMSLFELGGSAS